LAQQIADGARMDTPAPPSIFSPDRRQAIRARMGALQTRNEAPHYLAEDMAEDVLERLGFLRHEPMRALVIGQAAGALRRALEAQGCEVTAAEPLTLDEEQPYPFSGFDLVASLGTLDTVNDLPGALIHIRRALAPGGLAIAQFPGAGSLSQLRGIMLEADGERPAARMHPLVDVRAGAQLLQRAGWKNPVADSRSLTVRFGSFERLVADLRAQGLTSALVSPGPPLSKTGLERARQAFKSRADADGKLSESFEILTLTGWKP
jgi:SAM-dependent methyltransferase